MSDCGATGNYGMCSDIPFIKLQKNHENRNRNRLICIVIHSFYLPASEFKKLYNTQKRDPLWDGFV